MTCFAPDPRPQSPKSLQRLCLASLYQLYKHLQLDSPSIDPPPTMSPHLTLSPSAPAFPYGAALAARHLGIPIEWSADGTVAYGKARGNEAVEQAIAEQIKGKGVRLAAESKDWSS